MPRSLTAATKQDLLALSLLVLAGCGGGSGAPARDAAANATAAPAAPPLPEPAPPPVTTSPPAPAVAGSDIDLAWAGQGGEPFDVKAYLAGRAEPPDNAAPLYLEAFALIDGAVGGEDAKALGREISGLANLGLLAGATAPSAQIGQTLAKASAAIQKIDAAQAKPVCVFPTPLKIAARLNHAQAARGVARLSLLEIYDARQKNDFAKAQAAIRRGLRTSRDLQRRGHLVAQLVSIACDGILLGGIEAITLNDPNLSPGQCDAIHKLLMEHQQSSLNSIEEGLKVEYISTRTTFHDLQTGRMTFKDLLESIDPSGAMAKLPMPQSQTINFEPVIPTINRLFAKAIQESTGKYTPSSGSRVDIAKMIADAKSAAESGDTAAAQASGIAMMLTAQLDPVKEAQFRAQAHLAGTQMLVALQRYKLAHQELPADLATAAAESELKTVPADPYSGEPLRYAVLDGRPTIYSIGKDQQDDGGLVDWKSSTQPGDFLFVLGQPSQAAATGQTAKASAAAKSKAGKSPTKGQVAQTNPKSKSEPKADTTKPTSAPSVSADNEPEIRTWTSTAGTTIEAELVAVDGPNAVLKKKDGAEVRVPLSKLSKFDQQWIKNNAP